MLPGPFFEYFAPYEGVLKYASHMRVLKYLEHSRNWEYSTPFS